MPNSGSYQTYLEAALTNAGLDVNEIYFTSVIKCRSFDVEPRKPEFVACAPYLADELAWVKPEFILAFGNEPLKELSGHSGIMKWRGKVIEAKAVPGASMFATISPAAVMRNPRQEPAWRADLKFFANATKGIHSNVASERPKITVAWKKDHLPLLKEALATADTVSYDIETTGFDEFDPDGAIVSVAFTLLHRDKGQSIEDGTVTIWALPLWHPQSPFRLNWRKVLQYVKPGMIKPHRKLAHNGKFDDRWLHKHGVPMDVTFDTMLAAHILDENREKGLKPLARVILGVGEWAISTKNLIDTPLKEVLLYNALDTYYTFLLWTHLRKDLIDQPRLLKLFMRVTMPASPLLREVEQHGIWVDREKLDTAHKIAFDTRDHIDEQLMQWVPDPASPGSSLHAQSNEPWPTKGKTIKPVEVNFNPSNFARWWLFEHLGLPIYERGKTKADGSPGDPSMREGVMFMLRETGHPVIDLLLERAKWQKYCSTYVNRYKEIMDENHRIHTTFKIAGTVTGRMSSGKADDEKISSRADRGRGVNLQQVPRDPFIRGLFGAPPGWAFIEADFSQVELRLGAYIAREPTMLQLFAMGADLHIYIAARALGIPDSQVTKAQRKEVGKPTNFGFLYGMYPKKFVITMWEQQQMVYTLQQAEHFRKTYFREFPGLQKWHTRQKRIAHQNGRVVSPLGRIRHLPDIYSEVQSVVMEAERQAINSPVQAMGSDMNTLSGILINQNLKAMGLRAHVLGVVHDAVNLECYIPDLPRALPMIKDTMENLPFKELFGAEVTVPIISDLQVGSHWGGATELTTDQIYNFDKATRDLILPERS